MTGVLHQSFINKVVTKCGLEEFIPSNKEDDLSKLSTLGIKYPTLRDHPLHSPQNWLDGKRADDGSEGLWRIHDSLYDFGPFVDNHPGGRDWLRLTEGTDITEAFESHHLSGIPKAMLQTYFVRIAKQPRNYPFTFAEDGFYKVLKRKIRDKLSTVPKHSADRSKFLTDMLLISYIGLALLAVYFRSFVLGFISGIFLSLAAIAAHNFFHQKDNFRMYYFDFTFMQSSDWRISHVLSHHLYTNTVNDLEISSVEPFLQYLPTKKYLFFGYLSWGYSPIVYAFIYVGQFIKKILQIINTGKGFSWELLLPFIVPCLMWLTSKESPSYCALMYLWIITISSIYFGVVGLNAAHHHPDIFHDGDTPRLRSWELLLPFIVPCLMWLTSKESPSYCAIMYLWIITISSIYFGVVGLNAAHHHPDIFHDGDTPRAKTEMDWGIYQLDAVMDRKDITGSHFLVLTNFGDHALHHLFPTIDHGLLEYLYPVFLETCEEFGIEWKLSSQMELIKGQYRQLVKTKPNRFPPKQLNKLS